MRDRQTGEAVRDQHHLRPRTFHRIFNGGDPLGANRMIPIALFDAYKTGMRLFPQRLPVQRTGVADAGEDEDRRTQFRLLWKRGKSSISVFYTHLRAA